MGGAWYGSIVGGEGEERYCSHVCVVVCVLLILLLAAVVMLVVILVDDQSGLAYSV